MLYEVITKVLQRPGGVLARRAAAEIVAGHDDLRIAVRLLIEHEIRLLAAVRVEAQLVKDDLAESSA